MLGSFSKDFIVYGVSSSISRFFSIFLVPIFTKVFAPEEYGAMDLIGTIIAFTSIFGMMQLESAVSRFFFAEKKEKNRNLMISTAMWSILLVSTFLLIILSSFASTLSLKLFNSSTYVFAIVIAGLTIPISNLNSLFTVVIRFKKKPFHYLVFQSTQMLLSIGVTIWLVLIAKIGITGVFIGQLAGFLLTAIGMSYYLRKHLLFKMQLVELKKMLRYSLPLVPAVAGTWANTYINRFVMLGYLSIAEIGIYAVALKVASIFKIIESAFRMAWPPFFWETYETNKNHRKIFSNIQQHTAFLLLGLVFLVTLFSDEIVGLFATSEYLIASNFIGLIALSLVISGIIGQTTSLGPGITKRTEFNTLTFFLSVAVNVGSLFILVPTYGLIGVPFSLLLGSITKLTVSWYISEKIYFIGFNKTPMIIYLFVVICFILVELKFTLSLSIKVVLFFVFCFVMLITYRKTVFNILKTI